jgi:molybdate-binding protein/DNA-binding XRE family transcriptional regulator
MNMSQTPPLENRIKAHRVSRGWSQAELAKRAGISRAAVSAIEINRLVPSVAAALSLAAVFGCTVEELFGSGAPLSGPDARWAWPPSVLPSRYWLARVGERLLLFPAETTVAGGLPHDGVLHEGSATPGDSDTAARTLVVACCDPAAGLLATEYARATGYRLLVLSRSSKMALALLKEGLVHVAGLHLATHAKPNGNMHAVKVEAGAGFTLAEVAKWEEGVVVASQAHIRNVRDALRLRWVGREAGSGAAQCQEELLGKRSRPRRMAFDHRGVAEAVRCGWADAGVCLRLTGEEAGLRFFSVRQETYELCFATTDEMDPRLQALLRILRSRNYRKLLDELPGYDSSNTGQLHRVH